MDHHIVLRQCVAQSVPADSFHTNPDVSLLAASEAAALAALEERDIQARTVLTELGLGPDCMRSDPAVGGEMGADAPPEARYRMTPGWYFDVPAARAAALVDALFARGFEFNNLMEFRAGPDRGEAAYAELRRRFETTSTAVFREYAAALGEEFSPHQVTYTVTPGEDGYSGDSRPPKPTRSG